MTDPTSTPEPTPAAVDRVLTDLRGDPQKATRGAFTLDREKAREKMRVFQLPDPRRYVLELVQAAACQGATGIRFDVDADDLRMRFDGVPFTLAAFEDLYAALFRRSEAPGDEALRELALGLNAAMALNPRWVRVRSGDGETGVELVLRPGEPDRYGECPGAGPGTVIHVKSRLRPGLIASFFRNLSGALPEEVILCSACTFSCVPIDLEGRTLSRGLDLPDVLGRFRIDRPGIQGVGGFPLAEGAGASSLHLVRNGVWIQTVEIPCWPRGYLAVVDGQRLRLDVSRSAVVHDEAFDEIVEVVKRSVAHSVAALARSLVAPDQDPSPAERERAERLVKLALRGITALDVVTGAEPGSPVATMASVPLWRRPGGDRVSLGQIVAFKAGGVGYVTETFNAERGDPEIAAFLDDPDRLLLYLPDPDDQTHLQELLGKERFRAMTSWIKAGVASRVARREWLSRKARPELRRDRADRHLVVMPLATDVVTGELGLLREPVRAARLRLVARGGLLGDVEADLPFPGLDAALEAGFLPTRQYRDAARSGVFTRAMRDVLQALPALYDQLAGLDLGRDSGAEERRIALLVGYLHAALRPGFGAAVLAALGASTVLPGSEPLDDDAAFRPALGIGGGAEVPGALARVPLFRSAGRSGRHSLAELALHRGTPSGDGLAGIAYVEDACPETPDPGELVLRLAPVEVELLEAAFGPGCLRSAADALRQRRLERQFLERTPETPRVAGTGLPFRARFRASSPAGLVAAGEIGFEVGEALPVQPWKVRLLRNQRHLAFRELHLGLPPAQATIDCDGLTPSPGWDDAVDDDRLALVRTILRRAGEVLLRALARQHEGLPSPTADQRRSAAAILRGALAHVAPRRWWGQAWERLAADGESGERIFARIHDLLARHPVAEVHEAFQRERDRPEPHRFERLLSDLEAPLPVLAVLTLAVEVELGAPGPGAEVAAAEPLPLVPALRTLAVLPGWGETCLSLDRLLAYRDAGQGATWVPELTDLRGIDPPAGPLLRVSAEEAEALTNLLGEEHLRRDEDLEARARAAAEFRERRAVDDLGIVDALLSVPLQRVEFAGTLGISKVMEADARLALHRERKLLGYHWGFSPLPVLGSLNDDRLTPSERFDGAAADEHLEWLLARCREQIPALYQSLAERYPFPLDQHRVGRRRLLEYLAEALPAWDGQAETLPDPVTARIADLPLFEAVEGPFASSRRETGRFTLLELGESYRRYGRILHCASATTMPGFEPARRPVVAAPEDLPLLGRIFARLVNHDQAQRHEWLLVRAKIDPAQRLPDVQKVPALVRRQIQTEGIQGQIYLPAADPGPLEVQLGYQGCRIAAIPAIPVFPCAGRIEVAPETLPFVVNTVAPDAWLLATLDQDAAALYQDLAAALPAWEQAGAAELEPALVRLRACLVAVDLRLSTAGAEIPAGWRSFYRVHRLTRVFRLADGKLASLVAVLKHRPPELAGLGLWEDPEPGPEEAAPPPIEAPAASPAAEAAPPLPETPIPVPPVPVPPLSAPPAPPPPPPTREASLAAALHDLLGAVSARDPENPSGGTPSERAVLRHLRWSDLRVVPGNPRQLVRCKGLELRIHARHPLIARVLAEHDEDPVLLAFLASAIYSAVNLALEEIGDDDEQAFHRLLAAHLVEGKGDCT